MTDSYTHCPVCGDILLSGPRHVCSIWSIPRESKTVEQTIRLTTPDPDRAAGDAVVRAAILETVAERHLHPDSRECRTCHSSRRTPMATSRYWSQHEP